MTPDALLRGFAVAAGHPARLSHAALPADCSNMTARPFHGWQRQANGPSVQAALETAVLRLLRRGASRVSAPAAPMPACMRWARSPISTWRAMGAGAVRGALNFHLRPAPIAVLEARAAAADFHARFSAHGRRYLYRILNRRAPPALERGRVWHVPVPLDVERDARRRRRLWSATTTSPPSASSECQAKSPVKTLDGSMSRAAARTDRMPPWARSFLHHQVRNMVGTLKMVGEGKAPTAMSREALAARTARPPGRPRRRRAVPGGSRVC